MESTATFKNLNLLNYFTIWITIWFILFINNIVKYNPIIPYILIIYPTLYMLYVYIKDNKDTNLKRFITISASVLMHYVPLIYLYLNYETNIRVDSIIITLILINLYLIYTKNKNLDINKIYNDIYLNNKLY
tara:strand:- start:10237 stop:10632 length:396 start_codon:yes stop_codon:yes gene_type:complete